MRAIKRDTTTVKVTFSNEVYTNYPLRRNHLCLTRNLNRNPCYHNIRNNYDK